MPIGTPEPITVNTLLGNNQARPTYTQPAYSALNQPVFGGQQSLAQTYQPTNDFQTFRQNQGITDAAYGDFDQGQQQGILDSFNSGEFSNDGGSMLGNMTGNDMMGIASFGMNAFNMLNQWDYQDSMLALAEQADARSQEQWGVTKEEMGRIKRVRENISAGYNQGGNYQQQAAANPSERQSEYIK